jgi:hypothetical protein
MAAVVSIERRLTEFATLFCCRVIRGSGAIGASVTVGTLSWEGTPSEGGAGIKAVESIASQEMAETVNKEVKEPSPARSSLSD